MESLPVSEAKFINEISQALSIINDTILKEKIISLDCEGVELSKKGELTLIQICLSDGRIFLFDVVELKSDLFNGNENKKGLKEVLENVNIIKLAHGYRQDYDSIFYQFNTQIKNCYDTQVLYYLYEFFVENRTYTKFDYGIGLGILLKNLLGVEINKKNLVNELYKINKNIWKERPLSKELIEFASKDVRYLLRAFDKLKSLLSDKYLRMGHSLSALILLVDEKRKWKIIMDSIMNAIKNLGNRKRNLKKRNYENCILNFFFYLVKGDYDKIKENDKNIEKTLENIKEMIFRDNFYFNKEDERSFNKDIKHLYLEKNHHKYQSREYDDDDYYCDDDYNSDYD